mmetsp:Transcript_46799/g.111314  ORF Transcript_46799/g.111314 Transcript_46799/m.111314 type:complete len:258 (-) Transcript_46799:68-841(-)
MRPQLHGGTAPDHVDEVPSEVSVASQGLKKWTATVDASEVVAGAGSDETMPAPPSVSSNCQRTDHARRGQDHWEAVREAWLGPARRTEAQGMSSADWSPLPEPDNSILRTTLASTSLPFPRLPRSVPLPQAVKCATALWEEDSGGVSASFANMAQAARASAASTSGALERLTWGLVKWGKDLYDFAIPGIGLATKPDGAESISTSVTGDQALRKSLRARGGVGGMEMDGPAGWDIGSAQQELACEQVDAGVAPTERQ